MTTYKDVEMIGDLEPIVEKPDTGAVDNYAPTSVRSTGSRSSRGRRRRRSREEDSFQWERASRHSHSPDRTSRNRSRAPSDVSHGDLRADAQPRSSQTFNSVRSRPSTRDGPIPSNMAFTQQVHQAQRGSGDALFKTGVDLDRDHPGEFAVRHHFRGLVVQLDEYKAGPVRSVFDAIQNKLMGRKDREEASSEGDGKRFRVSFAEVQRMRIRKLQCQLVRHVVKMRLNGHESSGWEETLKEYIKAVQDHDYMEERSKSFRDPFLATGEYAFDNYVLNCNIDNNLAQHTKLDHAVSLKQWEPADTSDPKQHHESICGTRNANIAKTWYLGFKDRILLAAVGGAFLIGPMWLMVLQSGLYASLVTTTAFVAGFGLLMAYFLEAGKDVLGSTAAYAAVLVVFVGTSTQSPTESST